VLQSNRAKIFPRQPLAANRVKVDLAVCAERGRSLDFDVGAQTSLLQFRDDRPNEPVFLIVIGRSWRSRSTAIWSRAKPRPGRKFPR
jgi:hypothetical protein